MNNKNRFAISLIAIFSSMCGTLQADPSGYFRWKDAEGNLKMSDRPPKAGIEAEFVRTSGSSRTSNTQTDDSVKKVAETTEPKTMEIMPPKDPARCQLAKANMKAFEGYSRIRITDTDGTKRLITEEEKKVQVKRAISAIDQNCD